MANAFYKHDLLLVDDEAAEAMLFMEYFKETPLEGRIKHFQFAEDFIHYMQKVKQNTVHTPKLILLDIRMPLINGFEILRKIWKDFDFVSMPLIIMYSNSKDESDMEKAFSLGADDYKIKPCGKAEYLNLIEFLIRRIDE